MKQVTRLRATLTALSAVALATALVSCASDSPTTSSAPEAGGALETTELLVGIVPVADHAAVFHAIAEGYFDEEGLSVTAQPAQGGAAALPTMIAGDMQAAFATYPSFLLAHQSGIPIKIVAMGAAGTLETAGVFASPDSGITEPTDLAGKKIAVNTLNNAGDITIKAALADLGVDVSSIEFIELAFPDMQAALERGSVDAAWAAEPFQSGLKAAGMVKVLDNYSGPADNVEISGIAMTAEFVEQNPNTAAAFSRAVEKANRDLAADPDISRTLVTTYSETPEEVAQNMELPVWHEGFPTVERLDQWNTLMVDTGVLTSPVDLSELVFNPTQ